MTALYNEPQRAADWLVQSGAPLDIFAAAAVGDIATIERLLQPPAAGINAYSSMAGPRSILPRSLVSGRQ